MYQLQVGGKPFAVDSEDLDEIGSPFLTALLDAESEFARPVDGVFRIEADAACFSAFLNFRRFGVLPKLPMEESFVLDQADFWGLREQILAELQGHDRERSAISSELRQFAHLSIDMANAKRHHNYRYGHEGGVHRWCRVLCTECGNRDFKRCFREGSARTYTTCKGCNKRINYSKDLGWCHKCSRCRSCQKDGCPNDDFKTCNRDQEEPKTTEQLEEELERLERGLTNSLI